MSNDDLETRRDGVVDLDEVRTLRNGTMALKRVSEYQNFVRREDEKCGVSPLVEIRPGWKLDEVVSQIAQDQADDGLMIGLGEIAAMYGMFAVAPGKHALYLGGGIVYRETDADEALGEIIAAVHDLAEGRFGEIKTPVTREMIEASVLALEYYPHYTDHTSVQAVFEAFVVDALYFWGKVELHPETKLPEWMHKGLAWIKANPDWDIIPSETIRSFLE